LAGVNIQVFDNTGQPLRFDETTSTGSYRINSLPPSATGYTVCFDASSATGGPSVNGYLDECFDNVAWDGFSNPSGTPVPTTSGNVSTVNATIASASAIAGKVTATSGGAGIGSVFVSVYDAAGNQVGGTNTAADGNYVATNLPAGTYFVCFDASQVTSPTGYLNECFNNVPWDGSTPLPPTTLAVPVAAGSRVTGKNAVLDSGGAIAGTITGGGVGLGNVQAYVLTATGNYVSSTTTRDDGTYVIKGLRASSTYRLCFDGSFATGGPSATGYLSECYLDKRWDGFELPAGTTAVVVTAGATTSRSASLATAGAISGTVTAAADGSPLQSVFVVARDSVGVQSFAQTDIDGTYIIRGLMSGTYSVCFDASDAGGGPSSTGYLDQCFDNAPWDGQSNPTGATFTVTAGATASGKSAALSAAGAIAGTVTATSGGAPVSGVSVAVWTAAGDQQLGGAQTADDGTYQVSGLPASATGYVVCFGTSDIHTPPAGYLAECYNDVAWDQSGPLPDSPNLVAVTGGATTANIDAALAAGGGITGTVTNSADGTPVADIGVTVFNQGGNQVAFANTDDNGTYVVSGLPTGGAGYSVCFDPSFAPGGLTPECYNNVGWDLSGLPAGTTPVAVTSGAVATVDAALSPV
jgi:5-hydroxyisourate hydrolase-like protein (transthyretin family)